MALGKNNNYIDTVVENMWLEIGNCKKQQNIFAVLKF